MKRAIFISDLHAGSAYGLLPPNFAKYDGTLQPPNAGQQYLWECWKDFCERAHRFKPDFIVHNGDAVEGPQRKSNGYELCLVPSKDQCDAAVDVLSLLKRKCPKAKWFFTAGTPYHVGEWNEIEEAIAVRMGAEQYPSVGFGKYCREVLWANVEGVQIEVTHHPAGSSTGFYRMTTLDRDGQWSALAAKDATKGIPKSEVLFRSHHHFFGVVEHASKLIVQLPCWKLQDRHSRKGGLHRFHPDIGGVLVEFNGSTKEASDRCVIRKELYDLPKVEIVTL